VLHSAIEKPSVLIRAGISAIVLAHLSAIAVAVTSYSSPGFPAPELAVRASGPLQPYLQLSFLNNAYRFFAPNPGTPSVFWFRIQYEDQAVRWFDLPGRPPSVWRPPYQRRLNLALQLGQQLAFVAAPDGQKQLTPAGLLLLESAVRHVASSHARSAGGQPIGVRTVGVYCVFHTVITPQQVRDGWHPTDLRTYRPTFVGAYTARGERVDEFRPAVVDHAIDYVTTGILEVDVWPRLRERQGADAAARLAELALPEPIERLLTRHPDLLAIPPGDPLKRRIEALIGEGPGDR
jgi:hypothetical protein